ncbi:hypothetical protein JNUCC23_02055 [Peribacillus sp. JNUCC 23]
MRIVEGGLYANVQIKVDAETIKDCFLQAGIEFSDYKLKRINKILNEFDQFELKSALDDTTLDLITSLISQTWNTK